ncbi:MAG: hypothetical protein HXX18_11700, partial [Bacteroidetes bacterium]|nr:hypothetical protein [Bacteroidota bacterium]
FCMLNGNSTISNFNTFDTLSLAAGHVYLFGANDTTHVNKELNVRGNNCFTTILRSTQQGVLSHIQKPGSMVSGDFLEVRDINAMGGATYYAGTYSVDLGNNLGWIFTNSPGYVYGLGPDTAICYGEALQTINFNGAASYLWSTGATGTSFNIINPGTYWVQASYGVACVYSDTINVTVKPKPVVTALSDTLICPGATIPLHLTASGGSLPYSYNWNTSQGMNDSTLQHPMVSPLSTTQYTGYVKGFNGCIGNDSVSIRVSTLPQITVNPTNPTDCGLSNGYIIATASGGFPYLSNPAYHFSWNQTPIVNGNLLDSLSAGSYQVTVYDSIGCSSVSSVSISDPNAPLVSITLLGNTICQNDTLTVTAVGANTYEYFIDGVSLGNQGQNGILKISGLSIGSHNISAKGNFNNCFNTSAASSFLVNALPFLFLGNDTIICSGQTFTITATSGMNAYLWSTGAITQSITVTDSSHVNVQITGSNGCKNNDSINISSINTPSQPLVANVIMCVGTSVTIQPTNSYSNTIQLIWNGPNGFYQILSAPNYDLQINNATTLMSGVYTVKARAGGCESMPSDLQLTVNPKPITPNIIHY